MDLSQALAFARDRHGAVLATIGREGRPQLTNVAVAFGDDGVGRISTTEVTVKVRNLRQDPRCTLHVGGDHFYQYVVFDGTATLSPVATAPDDAVVEQLVAYYRAVSGDHPDWDDYRAAMVRDRRLVITVTPEHAYGMIG